jgi:hypothetical protein
MADDNASSVETRPWAALLARSQPPRQRLDVILSHPAAASLVARMPIEDFYFLVKDLGVADSAELLGFATAEQLRGCLDFDIWERDHVVILRILAWLRVLCSEVAATRFVEAIRAIDIELLAFLFASFARVYDRTLGEEPDEGGTLPSFGTPDTFFTLEIEADSDTTQILEQFLDRLYAVDAELARRILLEAKWGMVSELEESSYRWRSGRMSDLGFIEYYEAIEVYRYLSPQGAGAAPSSRWQAAAPHESPTVLPAVFAASLASESFLNRVLAQLADARLVEDLGGALLSLLNRVLAADRVDPAELDAVQETVARARDTLSLGLEHLAGGDVPQAAAVLRQRPLIEIFRIGFSLGIDLQREARKLRAAGNQDAAIEPLLGTRPQYPRHLDQPPAAGTRPFCSLADVERVRDWLSASSG